MMMIKMNYHYCTLDKPIGTQISSEFLLVCVAYHFSLVLVHQSSCVMNNEKKISKQLNGIEQANKQMEQLT